MTTNTTTKYGKLGRLVLSLLVCSAVLASLFVGILAFADETPSVPDVSATLNKDGNPYIDIVANNVSYEELMHVYYAAQLNLGDGGDFEETAAKIKVLFWNAPQSEYIKESNAIIYTAKVSSIDIGVTISVSGTQYNENMVYLRSHGIPAKEIGETIYMRAYFEDENGNTIYSEVHKYSVLRYVYDRFEDEAEHPELVTDDQMELYRNILRYGGIAQKVLDYNTDRLATDKFADIRVVDGVLADGFTRGLYSAGESYTVVAEATKDSQVFRYWQDDSGNKYNEASRTFTVGTDAKNVTYTAVYGSSAYVTVDGGEGGGEYAEGEEFTITAADRSEDKYKFLYWTVNDEVVPNSTQTMTFTATAGVKTYVAHYAAPTTVTVSGGTVNLGHVTDGTTATTLTVAPGETYAVTAAVPPNMQFSKWSDDRKAAAFTLTAAANSETPVSLSFTAQFGDSTETVMAGWFTDNGIDAALASSFIQLTQDLGAVDIYEWVAQVYDPETGAFYYSISARDHYGFLPDVESSSHALSILVSLGLPRAQLLTAEQEAKYTSWVQSLQNSVEGKFYHPQWGVNVSNSRDGRDQQSSVNALYLFGYVGGNELIFHNSAYTDKANNGTAKQITLPLTTSMTVAVSKIIATAVDNTVIANRFQSPENFVAYLNAELIDRKYDYYSLGNYIVSQSADIARYNLAETCLSWFTDRQDQTTGLWSADLNGNEDHAIDYDAVSALMKIGALYASLGSKLPNAGLAYENAIKVATGTAAVGKIVDVYNPLYAMKDLYRTYKNDAEIKAEFDAAIKENAETLISVTRTKLDNFDKGDGAYSYLVDRTLTVSQGPTVSLGLPESDGNATTIAVDTCEFLLYLLTGGKHESLGVLPTYVGAIYVDKTDCDIVTLTDGTWRDSVGNAVEAENVIPTSHLDRFKALLGAEDESRVKSEAATSQNLVMTFDGDNTEMEEGRYDGTNVSVENGTIKLVDASGENDYVKFIPVEQDDDVRYYEFGFDMKVESASSGSFLWVEFSYPQIRLDVCCSGSSITFKNYFSDNSTTSVVDDTTKQTISLDKNSWFTVKIKVYPGINNPTSSDKVAEITFTQGGNTYTSTVNRYYHPADYPGYNSMPFESGEIWGYGGAASTVYIDNVRCIKHNNSKSNPDGDYNFDRETEHTDSYSGGSVIDDIYKTTTDNVYSVAPGATATLTAKEYTGTYVTKNFNHTELKLRASGYTVGNTVATIGLTDTSENIILAVKLVAIGDGVFNLVSVDGSSTIFENLTADAGEWIQLRIDYYYGDGRVDFVARYNDRTVDAIEYPNGLYETVGATCTDYETGTGVTASSFKWMKVVAESDAAIELDDVYVRNVKVPTT